MFELQVAARYLIPRRRQLSVSLIAFLSVGVIALVVWLSLVFLSVTEGIEKKWLHKLTSFQAPLRITPTDAYYASYYYQVDAFSHASHFRYQTIGEKLQALLDDPYDPLEDGELPSYLSPADSSKNPVKGLFQILSTLREQNPDLRFQDFELGGALLRLQMLRPSPQGTTQSFLTQASYITSFPHENPSISSLLTHAPLEQESGIFLAKSFQDLGVLVGDQGYLSYSTTTASAHQEQRLPVVVAGFYDPGVVSIGAKCVLAPASIAHTIHTTASSFHLDKTQSNGILVWFDQINQAQEHKASIEKMLAEEGLDPYWTVTTFRDYDFAKDLLQQFQSDQYLFMLVGVIILIVACSNIISLLILLVNDKKKEIGILLAMGASPASIATIFGMCGTLMGVAGAALGICLALLTLHNIDLIAQALSWIQGHAAFNPMFFGSELPNALSSKALLFMAIATPLLALCAGSFPAIKAARLKPSPILRSE